MGSRRELGMEMQVRNGVGDFQGESHTPLLTPLGETPLLSGSTSTATARHTAEFCPSQCTPRFYDYILVGKKNNDQESEMFRKQHAFKRALEAKDFDVKEIAYEDKVFLGIRAPDIIFEKYKYLLKVSDSCNGCCEQQVLTSTRIRVVHFILENMFIDTGENLHDLMNRDVFQTKFCLHEEEKNKKLQKKWTNCCAWFHWQPISDVKNYFGEKVALYYLWLGWYTWVLVPAAVIGIVVFLYGLAFFNTSPLIKEVCEANTIMCPLCDKKCKVWQLSDTCSYAKVNHLFDNEGTVAFAMFMAVWSTVFLKLWRRHRALHVSQWNVTEWSEDEDELILEVVNDPHCLPKEYQHSYLRSTIVLVLVTFTLMLIIGLAQALVVFRVVATALLSEGSSWQFLKDNANSVAVMMGAVLHYFTITIMTWVNKKMAWKLCEIEKTRSFAATERSFTVKMFTFQFFTLFSSLFYVAFFLGRINGHPGNYLRIAGKWRLEECHPSGCLTDLFIQMAVILVLKQSINNVIEFGKPWISWFWKKKHTSHLPLNCEQSSSSEGGEKSEACDNCTLTQWLYNYHLNSTDVFSLFNEFLEMVIQFSFTTIFVAAFPLAPFLALCNNIIEIRLDAYKMVQLERRLVPNKTNNIGVWNDLLEAIGVMAVIANGLVIGITSDFIPRLVYRYRYGPCATGGDTDVHCMTGYVNNTLSVAYMSNASVRNEFIAQQLVTHTGLNVTQCSYKDYRNEVDHSLTSQFWLILALRFIFVLLFEHIVVVCKYITAWFVPDCPMQVKNTGLQDKLERIKAELREEDQRRFSSSNV